MLSLMSSFPLLLGHGLLQTLKPAFPIPESVPTPPPTHSSWALPPKSFILNTGSQSGETILNGDVTRPGQMEQKLGDLCALLCIGPGHT